MRTDATTNQKLRSSFARIRGDVRKMQKSINDLIYNSAVKNEEYCKKYSKEYLAVKRNEMRSNVSVKSAELKQQTKLRCLTEIGEIKTAIAEWTLQPLSAEASTLLESYMKYGIEPSEMELKAISESVAGSYVGQRVISELAKRHGFVISDFLPIEQINRMLTTLENDLTMAINAYNGQMLSDYSYTANDLDLGIADKGLSDWYVFAEDFFNPDRDTAFCRMEKLLTQLTDTDISISQAKRDELDRLFSDAETDAEKIEIASVVVDKDSSLSSALRIYDKGLYESACQALAETARARAIEAAEESLSAMKELHTAQRAEREAEKRLA